MAFRFIDLFAGIGGFRIGLEAVGGKCVFSSEIDKFCARTYFQWFNEIPYGDITAFELKDIPDHDVLAAGFPCQPFSLAGVSKNNALGREHGFEDKTRGTLFFNIAQIIKAKRPRIVFLENVKNLKNHDGGKTFEVIEETLKELRYNVSYQVVDAQEFVPQRRKRLFIVAYNKDCYGEMLYRFPPPPAARTTTVRDILEPTVDDKYTMSAAYWQYLQDYKAKHAEAGHGFGYQFADMDGVAGTLMARYYKDGSEILIPQTGKPPRRLTPRECARLQGFADDLPIVVSDTQAYKQFGNAVCPLVVEYLAQHFDWDSGASSA